MKTWDRATLSAVMVFPLALAPSMTTAPALAKASTSVESITRGRYFLPNSTCVSTFPR
ncbi:MAG: hypothetical protein LBV00_06435 [Propionibacteriaceae bacterium]|nr:hypothetical protein [Propionibacteriaceae bacterium]